MNRQFRVGYKLLFGLLGVSALVTEIAILTERGIFNAANFFSFFTVQSNILAVIILLAGALIAATGRKADRFTFLRGAVTFYMLVTGIVFALLLSGLEGVQLTAIPWDNIVLHYILPIAIVLDWIIDPPLKRIPFKQALLWISFPVAYLAYSLLRGPIAEWYPYPFLNPANGGYGQIAITTAAIMLGGIVLIFALTRIAARTTSSKK